MEKKKAPPPKFLLVDDHAMVRAGIADTLAVEFPDSTVDQAGSAQDAIAAIREKTPDLAIVDITMPGTNGLEFLKAAKQLRPNLKVLIFSMHPEEEYAVRSLKAGALGYVNKGAPPAEFIDAVRTTLRGSTYASGAITRNLVAELRSDPNRPLHETLSDREFEILRLIGQGKSTKEITWELALSENTVRTYRTRLLQKMNMKTTAELIKYALTHNLT